MDLSRSYDLPPSVQSRIRLLDWIAANGGTGPHQYVDLGPLFKDQDQGEALTIAGNLDALEESGLIRLQKTLAWEGYSCDVLPRGIDLIEELHARREDLLQRGQAARDAFLRWLFDCTLRGNRCPNSSDFPASRFGSYYGDPFTKQETATASEWLRDEEYLRGTPTSGAGIVRPTITTKGQKVVENQRSVNADAQQPAPYSVTTVNVTGSGNNVAANSTNVTQTTTVTMNDENARQLQGLAESLAQLTNSGLLGLDEDQAREAALIVESLRETAEHDDVPGGTLQELLTKTKEVALSGTGTAIGQTFVAAVEKVLQVFGLA